MRKGFSLIEVLVFVTVLGVFFVAAATVVTFLLSTMKASEHRIIATRYAEEAIEWIKTEKEEDWSVFAGNSSDSGKRYCANTLNWDTTGACATSNLFGTPTIFKREIVLTSSGAPIDQVTVSVIVYWNETNRTDDVTIDTILKVWE